MYHKNGDEDVSFYFLKKKGHNNSAKTIIFFFFFYLCASFGTGLVHNAQ